MKRLSFLVTAHLAKAFAFHELTNTFKARKHRYHFGTIGFRFELTSMLTKTGISPFSEENFPYPIVSPATTPLTKEPEDSGHEIETN